MAKIRSSFICQLCGTAAPKWQGQCPGCGEWNSLQEGVAESAPATRFQSLAADGAIHQLSDVETA
ncbi:MAG: DNA repair protein RadA, partial [Iodobacter sp.]